MKFNLQFFAETSDELWTIKKSTLKEIADAIRFRKNSTENIKVSDLATEILSITPSDIRTDVEYNKPIENDEVWQIKKSTLKGIANSIKERFGILDEFIKVSSFAKIIDRTTIMGEEHEEVGGVWTITFADYGDTEISPITYDNKNETELPQPTKNGYEFIAWVDDEGNEYTTSYPSGKTGNITLTAKWQLVDVETIITLNVAYSPTISIKVNGENYSSGQTITTNMGDYSVITNSQLDNIFPYNKITYETDTFGNKVTRFPKIYYLKTNPDNKITISNKKINSDYEVFPCFLSPLDNETELPYVEVFTYCGVQDENGNSVSKSGLSYGVTGSNTYLGNTIDTGYLTGLDYYVYSMYSILMIIYFKTLSIPNVNITRVPLSSRTKTGGCDQITGLNGFTSTSMKYLGLEDLYGGFIWLRGLRQKAYSGHLQYGYMKLNEGIAYFTNDLIRSESTLATNSGGYNSLADNLKGFGELSGTKSYQNYNDGTVGGCRNADTVRSNSNVFLVGGAYSTNSLANTRNKFFSLQSFSASGYSNYGTRATRYPIELTNI